jgi:hypothetical protein
MKNETIDETDNVENDDGLGVFLQFAIVSKHFAGGKRAFVIKATVGASRDGHLLFEQLDHAQGVLAQGACGPAPGVSGWQRLRGTKNNGHRCTYQ